MYGTHLVNMQYDGAEFIFSCKVLFDDFEGKAALIFLRKAQDTFFALEFNADKKQDIRLS